MRFRLEQRFSADPDAVLAAFVDPDFYPALAALPNVGEPQVVGRTVEGDVVRIDVRYRFTGELSSAARRVLDPQRLTWVDHATVDLTARRAIFELKADHYADRFSCRGGYFVEADDGGSRRVLEADLTVRAPLVGRTVERAIVSGLEHHLVVEVPVVEGWVAARRSGGG